MSESPAMIKSGLAIGAVLVALVLSANPALAAPASYRSGSSGYDVSWPNCTLAPTGTFGVVGVNGGRPFTSNPCFNSESARARGTAVGLSVYVNTGYAEAYATNINGAACPARGADLHGKKSKRELLEKAWQIGCSEAAYSVSRVGKAASWWWLDVETANSWSANPTLNQFAIQGLVAYLKSQGFQVGAYSVASMWTTITGSHTWTPADGLDGTWPALASSLASARTNFCGRAVFTTVASVIVQYSDPLYVYDRDYAC